MHLAFVSFSHFRCTCRVFADTRSFDSGTAWRFFIFYIPLWIVVAFNLYVYWLIYNGLAPLLQGPSDASTKGMLRVVDRLKYYPMILIVCWTFATINRIYDSIHPRNPSLGLIMMQTIFQTLQGFFNAMVYGLTPSVRNVWRESLAQSNVGFLRMMANSGQNAREIEAAAAAGSPTSPTSPTSPSDPELPITTAPATTTAAAVGDSSRLESQEDEV